MFIRSVSLISEKEADGMSKDASETGKGESRLVCMHSFDTTFSTFHD